MADANVPWRVAVVAGEHSGDRLGADLIKALRSRTPRAITFMGVGGPAMEAAGVRSLFPLDEIAVMGPVAIAKRLPLLLRRGRESVAAVLAFEPDVLVLIDAPEFTHRVAQRVRRAAPQIATVKYVSPSVWAWRPGRAKAMRPYIDHLLALLPFEPDAHARLGGPACTYVGHPLSTQVDRLRAIDPAPLASRLGLRDEATPILVLPGSRMSEASRLLAPFGETIARLSETHGPLEVLIPAVPRLREIIAHETASWPARVHLLEGDDDKFASFRLAQAALAASGTVTLELAAAGTPMVVAYKVERWTGPIFRWLITAPSAVLANLVLGRNAFPEFIQEDCTPAKLTPALAALLNPGDALDAQRAALDEIPDRLKLPDGANPSATAADVVLDMLKRRSGGVA